MSRIAALTCLVAVLGISLAWGQGNEGDKGGKPEPGKPAAPAAGEEQAKLLAARLATLMKDLDALKGLDKRVAGAEKAARDAEALRPRVEELAKQLDALKTAPARLDKIDAALQKLLPAVEKVEQGVAKLEKGDAALTPRIDKLEKAGSALEPRLQKLEKGVADLAPQLQKLDKAVADLSTRLQKLEAAAADLAPRLMKSEKGAADLAPRLQKMEADGAALRDRLKALEEAAKKDRDEREKRLKEIEEKLKSSSFAPMAPMHGGAMPEMAPMHGGAMYGAPMADMTPPVVNMVPGGMVGPGCCAILMPAFAKGCFGEHFPVLTMFQVPCPCPIPAYAPGCVGPMTGGQVIDGGMMPMQPAQPAMPAQPQQQQQQPKKEKPGPMPPATPVFHQVSLRADAAKATAEVQVAVARKESRNKLDVRGLTEADADRLFWKGYDLYWRGNTNTALTLFEATVELDAKDARYWYYRALAEFTLGLTAAAEASLAKAVDLHTRNLPEPHLISQALERVQGPVRMKFREALDQRRAAR
ncbi:MAG: hypothetical protein U0736_23590 [Gemmataceae bacterium]